MHRPVLLIVDDDPLACGFCLEVLRAADRRVETVRSPVEALEALRRGRVALVLAEVQAFGASGLELVEKIKAECPLVDVIVTDAHASTEAAVRALKGGAADYLCKPFASEQLEAAVETTLARRNLYRRTRAGEALRLFQAARSFAAVEEPGRVLELGLAALLHVAEGHSGLCLLTGSGMRFMGLLHQRSLPAEHARALRDALVANRLAHLQALRSVEVWGRLKLRRAVGDALFAGLGEAAFVPLSDAGGLRGLFVLFRGMEGRFSQGELESAGLLGAEVELAYGAADRVRQARQHAFVDPLTELYNARYLGVTLDRRLAEAERRHAPLSVLFLDLDHFKQVNDVHGHLTGGQVLLEVSRIVAGKVREEDTVVRYGGDEFTILLPNTESAGALEVAERIREAIKEHVFLAREGKAIRLTACIGVATHPDDAATRDALIEQARRAMARGKEARRDAVCAARIH